MALDDGQRSKRDEESGGGGGGGKRAERRRAKVDRSGRVVDRAVGQVAHRTPSTMAEDVVSQALIGVGRQLLMTGDQRRQSVDKLQSRYDKHRLTDGRFFTEFGKTSL